VTRVALLLMLAALVTGCVSATPAKPGERVTEPNPAAAQPNALLGIEFMRRGDNNTSMEYLLKAIYHNPNSPLANNAIAVLYERLGENDKAEKHFEKAVDLVPDDSDALNNYGRFLCIRGRYAEAEQHFQKALENPLYRTPQNTYTNLGHCAISAGERGKAEHYFRAALGKAPNFAPALFQMAQLSWQEGNALQARAYLQRLTSVTRSTADVLWLGIQVEQALGDQDAVSSYALALRNNYPDSAEARQLPSVVPK